jgi:hypothetical protein
MPTPRPRSTDETPPEDQDSSTTTAVDTSAPSTEQMMRLLITGAVSLDNWSEIFRCFVSPAARMNLKRLRLGIHFELEAHDGQPLDPNDPRLKAMKEAARQLGLEFEEG